MNADRREELLLRVIGGELDSASAEFCDAFAGEPQALEAAREWLATAAALEVAGADLREAAAEEVRPADRELARGFLARVGAREHAAVPVAAVRRSWRSWGLAAAAVLVAVIGFAVWGGDEDVAPPLFLGVKIELLAPVGAVERWESFSWEQHPLPAGGSYRLVVEVEGREVLRREGIGAARYRLTADERARLGDVVRLRWSVLAVGAGADGAVLARGSAEATRR